MIIVGSGVTESPAGAQVLAAIARYVSSDKEKARFLNEEWNGVNVLQRVRITQTSTPHIFITFDRPLLVLPLTMLDTLQDPHLERNPNLFTC